MKTIISAALLTLPAAVMAEAPQVVTDIAPVHGLVARVMEGLGAPDLIVPPESTPHDFTLRPSQTRALENAALVFWTGPSLTPWLGRTMDNVSQARVINLNALPGTHLLDWRDEDGHEEEHDDHDHNDAHGHDDHAEDDHGDHDETHTKAMHDGHGHDPDEADPHSWLDPDNAKLWTETIATELAKADPDNAATYRANASAAVAEIDAVIAEVDARLAPHLAASFLVYHDAYHYFEESFGLTMSGSVAQGDAAAPGPARIRALQQKIAAEGITCLFTEPQFDKGLVTTLAEGSAARIAVLDPLGSTLPTGPGFYPALITGMADAMASCFEG
ncbi:MULTISPECIES: zinc ABC transporter substrate-binding protein [unclassified Marinovum]